MCPAPPTKGFVCTVCGADFSVPQAALDKYPGWTPKTCLKCRDAQKRSSGKGKSRPGNAGRGRPPGRPRPPSAGRQPQLFSDSPGGAFDPQVGPPAGAEDMPPVDPKQILEKLRRQYSSGPSDGLFTDGACSGNPGPGGWAAVWVKNDQLVDQRFGFAAQTTNNRMELTALGAGLRMIPPEEELVVWSDSQLCVKTMTQWAPTWEARGWKKKGGPIKNLDLVQEVYQLVQSRPKVELRWVKAHNGSLWNEMADALATVYLR